MKKWKKPLMASVAAICMGTAGIALTASAAPSNTEGAPEYTDEARLPPGKKDDGRHEERWNAFMAKKQAELHDRLKLSANQEGAWKTYADATAKNLAPAKRAPLDFDNMSAPDRLQKTIELMKERQAKMESQLSALKTFYATLTPEQQKVFDAETSPAKWREKAGDRRQKKARPGAR